MKIRALFDEVVLILGQALGLAPMEPVRVRSEDYLDPRAYSGRDIDRRD